MLVWSIWRSAPLPITRSVSTWKLSTDAKTQLSCKLIANWLLFKHLQDQNWKCRTFVPQARMIHPPPPHCWLCSALSWPFCSALKFGKSWSIIATPNLSSQYAADKHRYLISLSLNKDPRQASGACCDGFLMCISRKFTSDVNVSPKNDLTFLSQMTRNIHLWF